jgi:acetolactate synthase-1/2/3 large subunit
MHHPLRDRLSVPDTDHPAAVQARTIMKATDSLLTRTGAQSRPLTSRSGAQVLVDALKIHGVDTAFGVPGESYLAVLDALYDAGDAIKFVICRQEGGATNMAEAYGKMTGRPGICFVTRGPGAANASIGVHTAFQDSTPLILFIGQVSNAVIEREAFQEIDYRRMFGQMAKWVAQIDRAERVPEYLSHAFHTAVSGRPGPVVLALPEDMQTQRVTAPDTGRYQRVAAHPGPAEMQHLRELLSQAQRPLVILGGSGWDARACDDMKAFVTAFNLPVGCSFRAQDLIDNRDPHYVGDVAVGLNPKLAERIRASDLLLVIGARLGEWTTVNYTLVEAPRPKQKFVHVHAGAEELGRVYQGDLLINSGMPEFAAAARAFSPVRTVWDEWTQGARADLEAWQQPVSVPGRLNLSEVVHFLRNRLPPEAIITNGAGNFSIWVHRFYRYTGFRTQLGPTSGAMGYAVPAAVAAKLVHPDRPVIAFAGDGDFLMTGQELATARQYDLRIVFIVVNNGMYGTIRMHQEREYPGRVSGTELKNPDFAALARAYGHHGEVVESTAEFEPAFGRALAAKSSALLELRIDPEAITPRTTLSAIRAEALKTHKS